LNNTTEFKNIFQPIKINKMNLANRVVLPAMGNNYGSNDGFVTERQIDYYTERANGGAGLLITEMVSIDSPVGQRGAQQLRIDVDKYISKFQKLTEQIHKSGSKMAMQLCHAGLLAASDKFRLQTVAPSPVEYFGQKVTRELTAGEIEQIIDHFVQGAVRAKAANFDGVEVHAAHSYLLAHFLSPYFNKRRDDFGGRVENRARILLEIIRRIREVVGADYPVWCRMNGIEFGLEGGQTIDESKQIARMTEKAGCDAIHVSAGGYGSYYGYNRAHMGQPRGNMVELAAEIKKSVSIPVIAVGRIDLQLGEQILRDGKADLIAIGRGHIADPHLLKKTCEGRFAEIRPCLSCNVCVDDLTTMDVTLHCSVNACVGKEREYKITPALKTKKVMVIGGGPAGLEAAITAALRGHKVIIYEQQSQLGGKLILAATPPHKDEIEPFKDYLVNRVKQLGIPFELGEKATLAMIKKYHPDALVVASGALPILPKIPGVDGPNVVFAEDVLSGRKTGQTSVVIGGGLVGCETAEFLAQQNKNVIIVEMLAEIATGVGHSFKAGLLNRLSASAVSMLVGAQCKKITENSVVVTGKFGEDQTIQADSIILAVGAKANNGLAKTAMSLVPEIHVIGDCLEPRRIINAVSDGHRVGMIL
jgi:2,4-dienoyl-CoA reductase-like NADH-dependent reductase (Old Yellow Enzyme family)/thioredoxin reductase